MAAQVKRLAATRSYELRFDQGPARPLPPLPAKTPAESRLAFWPGEEPGGNRLERCLRLPAGF